MCLWGNSRNKNLIMMIYLFVGGAFQLLAAKKCYIAFDFVAKKPVISYIQWRVVMFSRYPDKAKVHCHYLWKPIRNHINEPQESSGNVKFSLPLAHTIGLCCRMSHFIDCEQKVIHHGPVVFDVKRFATVELVYIIMMMFSLSCKENACNKVVKKY